MASSFHSSANIRGLGYYGFANRSVLANRINSLLNNPAIDRQSLAQSLTSSGILRSGSVSQDISSMQVSDDMVSKMVTRGYLEKTFPELISDDKAIFNNSTLLPRLVDFGSRVKEHFDYTKPYLFNKAVNLVAGVGALAATAYGLHNLAEFEPLPYLGFGLGTLTILSLGVHNLARKLDPNSLMKAGERFINNKALALVMIANYIYATALMWYSDSSVSDIFKATGPSGLVGIGLGAAFLLNSLRTKHQEAVDRSYSTHPLPGEKDFADKRASASSNAIFGSANFITALAILFGANSANNFISMYNNHGLLPMIPVLCPVLGFAGKYLFTHYDEHYGPLWDKFKIHLSKMGVAAGAASALIIPLINGEMDHTLFLQYATLIGTAWTLFSQGHGVYSEINTTIGDQKKRTYPNVEPLGDHESRRLTRDVVVAGVNAAMGTSENGFAALFNALGNKDTHRPIIVCNDTLPSQKDIGKINQLKSYISWVTERQTEIFNRASNGVAIGTLKQRYVNLMNKARELSVYFSEVLPAIAQQEINARGKDVFEENVEAFQRSVLQELQIMASSFGELARTAQMQLEKGKLSEYDFEEKYSDLIGPFDPDFNYKIILLRKAGAGDPFEIRKGENVNAYSFFRSMTAYIGERMEDGAQPLASEYYISGSWTRIPNPSFSYLAKSGTMEASKFLWIRSTVAMNEMQKENRDFLSTDNQIAQIDNQPSRSEGFVTGRKEINTEINGMDISLPAGSYYYIDSRRADHSAKPAPKSFVFRDLTRETLGIITGSDPRIKSSPASRIFDLLLNQGFVDNTGRVINRNADEAEDMLRNDESLPKEYAVFMPYILSIISQTPPADLILPYYISEVALLRITGSKDISDAIIEKLTQSGIINAQGLATEKGRTISSPEQLRPLLGADLFQYADGIAQLLNGGEKRIESFPAWEFTDMQDRNVVKKDTRTLPALVRRMRNKRHVNLVYKAPTTLFAGSINVSNPFPEKKVDPNHPIELFDTNVSMQNGDIEVPLIRERATLPDWKDIDNGIRRARITLQRGVITAFSLLAVDRDGNVVKETEFTRESEFPRPDILQALIPDSIAESAEKMEEPVIVEVNTNMFLDTPRAPMYAEGAVSFAKIYYEDGSFAFSRLPYTNRPVLFNPDRLKAKFPERSDNNGNT